jgi:hypothetical protein
MSLIEEGRLKMTTTARSVLGEDLPLIDDEVTVEHLLAHRSGIGDYFDEEIDRPITDYVLAIPVHELDTIEQYLRVLDGYPSKFSPGDRFYAMFAGRIVSMDRVAEMVRSHSGVPSESARYGLGFWLHESRDVVELHGYDAGVSFRNVHDPVERLTHTVISNTSEGAWQVTDHLDELFTP